jgi:ABC-2 type transport system permease protein
MPGWLRLFVDVNPISLMATAIRGLLGGGATLAEVGLALIAPVVLTLVLAPVTLWLYRRQ